MCSPLDTLVDALAVWNVLEKLGDYRIRHLSISNIQPEQSRNHSRSHHVKPSRGTKLVQLTEMPVKVKA